MPWLLDPRRNTFADENDMTQVYDALFEDPDSRRIVYAWMSMPDSERQRMMHILSAVFDEYFKYSDDS